MRQTNEQDNRLRRYLLGNLSEAERDTLEAEFFADGERFEQVWAAENELVDAYVRGRLKRGERARFESHYLASQKHRERVAFAQSLLSSANDPITSAVTPGAKTRLEAIRLQWRRLAAFFAGPRFVLAAGLVAALLLIALSGSLWWRERSGRGEQVVRLPAASQEKPGLGEAKRSPQPNLNNSPRPNLPPSPEPQTSADALTPPIPPVTRYTYTFDAEVRQAGALPTLKIPADTTQVRLRVKAEAAEWISFLVDVRTVGGREVWRRKALGIRSEKNGITISATVPADKLASGDYVLSVSGIGADGQAVEVRRQYFRVSR